MKRFRFDLTSGQIGPNPVWLFNDKPVSLEINEDLHLIQDHFMNLLDAARFWKNEWKAGCSSGMEPDLPGERALWEALKAFEFDTRDGGAR